MVTAGSQWVVVHKRNDICIRALAKETRLVIAKAIANHVLLIAAIIDVSN
jgi:hypothetical protein